MDNSFKNLLVQALGPILWDPSASQLRAIADELARTPVSALSEFQYKLIIKRHCPNALFYSAEGLDNSDINTMLKMAIQAAAAKN